MQLFNRFKKILIIEDDKSLRRAIADKLRGEGYRIFEAADGQEGLRLALKERPNLILLDLMLPRMDGMSVLEELRSAKNAWGKKAKVMIITNLGETDQRHQRAAELGVLEYLDKSRNPLEDIVAKVQAAL